jgi:hypothetical protein
LRQCPSRRQQQAEDRAGNFSEHFFISLLYFPAICKRLARRRTRVKSLFDAGFPRL